VRIKLDEFKYFFNYSLLIISNFLVVLATPQDNLIFLRYNSIANIIFGIFIYLIYLRFKRTSIDKHMLLILIASYILCLYFFDNQSFFLYSSYPLIILWSEFFCSKFNLKKERFFVRFSFLVFSVMSFFYFEESFQLRFYFIIVFISFLVLLNKSLTNYEAKALKLIYYTIINLSCYYIPLILITFLNNDMKIIYIAYSALISVLLRLADISVRNALNKEKENINNIIKYSSFIISIFIFILGLYFNNFYLILLIIIPFIIFINLKNIRSY
jgi:hypothetical protein